MKPLTIVGMFSGQGSTIDYIMRACQSRAIPGTVVACVTDRFCSGVEYFSSGRHTLPVHVLPLNPLWKMFSDLRLQWDQQVLDVLNMYKPDLICLGGFMKILSPRIVQAYPQRILNIHPGPLPKLAGKDPQKKALKLGLKETGNTVHIVTEYIDDARHILATDLVQIVPEDTEDTLSQKLREAGYDTYISAIRKWRSLVDTNQLLLEEKLYYEKK